MNKPTSQPPAPGHLLAKEPDRIVNAMNNEERENRLIAVAAILLAVLIAGATAYWLNQDVPMVTTPRGSQSQDTARTEGATPLTGPEPAVAALPPDATVAQPAAEEPGLETLEADVYFDVGRSGLRAEARTLLAQQAEQVKAGGWVAQIQGYTDATGPIEYNQALGLRRAEAVKRYLVKLGVPASALTVASLGTAGALCADETAECRQRNRRVHVEFQKAEFPPASADAAGIQGTNAEEVLKAFDPSQASSEAVVTADPSSSAPGRPQP